MGSDPSDSDSESDRSDPIVLRSHPAASELDLRAR